MFRAFEATWMVTGSPNDSPLRDAGVVVNEHGTVVAAGPAPAVRASFPLANWVAVRGVLMPGLVNAYVRLEHAFVDGRLPGGRGAVAFFDEVSSRFSPWEVLEQDDRPVRDAVIELARLGTAAVGDVTASGVTVPMLLRSRIFARVFREVAGMSAEAARLVETFAREQLDGLSPNERARVSLTPHSLFGTHRDTVRSLANESRERNVVFALPLATSAAERAYLLSKAGAFGDFVRTRGFDVGEDPPMGVAGVEAALRLDALGQGTLAADLVDATREEIAILARYGADAVVMPRASLHVELKLPDVPTVLAEGLMPALGTGSSLASGDLDVLAEAKTLKNRFPNIPARTLLAMATSAGAKALRNNLLGELSAGKRPGVLLIEGDVAGDPEEWVLSDLRRPRRWLANPTRS